MNTNKTPEQIIIELITALYENKEFIAKNIFKFDCLAADRYTIYNIDTKKVELCFIEQGEQPHIEDNEIILPHLII
jgi:hypothetical protein